MSLRDLPSIPPRLCRAAFCVSGAGRIARFAVENAQKLGIDPVLMLAEQRASEDLEAFCAGHHVLFVRLPSERGRLDDELTKALTASGPDLICLTFDKLLPQQVVNTWTGRILNLHMGLLPETAGLHPMRTALRAGATTGGATVHEVTNGVDDGPVVAHVEVPIAPDDTVESLGARLYPLARDLFAAAISEYAGRLTALRSN